MKVTIQGKNYTKDQLDIAYEQGKPLVNDLEYDEALGIDNTGMTIDDESEWEKFTHTQPMASLSKNNLYDSLGNYSPDDVLDWIRGKEVLAATKAKNSYNNIRKSHKQCKKVKDFPTWSAYCISNDFMENTRVEVDDLGKATFLNKIHTKHWANLISRYHSMVSRCHDSKNESYEGYGGRGIKVCTSWRKNKKNFILWSLMNGFHPPLSIDRINNDKGYHPDNCRWTTADIQARNKRDKKLHKYKGKSVSVKDLCKLTGFTAIQIQNRLDKDWDIDKIVKTSISRHANKSVLYKGKKVSYQELSEKSKYNVSAGYLYGLIKEGMSPVQALNHKPERNKHIKQAKIYTYKDHAKSLKDWAQVFDIAYSTIVGKINKGISIADMVREYGVTL